MFSLTREQELLALISMVPIASMGLTALPWGRLRIGLPFPSWGRLKPGSIRIAGKTINANARVRHTHILGATGSGKTVLIENLLFQDLEQGLGCLIIDPKGDRELYERVRHRCKKLGRLNDLYYLSATFPEESDYWNPCSLGNVSELQSKFFNSSIYAEPHYAKWCEKALLEIFNRLTKTSPSGFTLNEMVGDLEDLCAQTKSRDEKLEGLYLDLYNLSRGEWGPILGCDPKMRSRREIRFLDLTQQNRILFVDLPTEAKKVQSSRIGRLITQELMLISGLRKIHSSIRSKLPFSVYIDEFDAFATESFSTFLNKARSSNFMIQIAHQTLSDLNQISPEFAGKILGNCDIRYVFRVDDPDDAERLARFFGTRRSMKKTYQTDNGIKTGRSSNREVLEFIISPDSIKTLRIGEAVLASKSLRIIQKIKIPAPKRDSDSSQEAQSQATPTTRGSGNGERKSGQDDYRKLLEPESATEIRSSQSQTPIADPWAAVAPLPPQIRQEEL